MDIIDELLRHEAVGEPAISIGEDARPDLVAVMRAVVHALHRHWQPSGLEALVEQSGDLAQREDGLEAARKVGIVERIAFLGDGERHHLERRIAENLDKTVPVVELRVGFQRFGDAGNDFLVDSSVGFKADEQRQIVVGPIGFVDDLVVEGLSHDDATVVLSGVESVLEDCRREGTKDVSAAEVHPCGCVVGLTAHGSDVKFRELIAFLLPFAGIETGVQYVCQFHICSPTSLSRVAWGVWLAEVGVSS